MGSAEFTIGSGGPDVPDDVYTVVCTKMDGPKTIVPKAGPNAGQEVDIFEWEFAIMDGEYADTVIQGSTSTSTGPRSKLYAWLTALLGGQPPEAGTPFSSSDIEGRMALAQIVTPPDSGWPKIQTLSAMPRSMRAAAQSQAMGLPAPSAPARQSQQRAPQGAARATTRPATARAAAQDVEDDDLPF